MPSRALRHWQVERAKRIDDLVSVHGAIAGPGPGRKWRTEQINWSLIVRLAAEFQGFSIDLHDLGADTFAGWSAQGSFQLQTVIRNSLTLERKLDRGNANPDNLREDFQRFGVDWWTALHLLHAQNEARRQQIGRLNRARNAIVHGQPDVIEELRAEGYPLTLGTVRAWRRAVGELAVHMDTLLSQTLGKLFQQPPPW
jgi:hypothetical protein